MPASPRWPGWRSCRREICPAAGKYGDNVQTCLDFVLSCCQESGLIASDQSHGPMYGHGFATLFLGEVYGMTGDEQVKEKLQKAVRLIQKTQNAKAAGAISPCLTTPTSPSPSAR